MSSRMGPQVHWEALKVPPISYMVTQLLRTRCVHARVWVCKHRGVMRIIIITGINSWPGSGKERLGK